MVRGELEAKPQPQTAVGAPTAPSPHPWHMKSGPRRTIASRQNRHTCEVVDHPSGGICRCWTTEGERRLCFASQRHQELRCVEHPLHFDSALSATVEHHHCYRVHAVDDPRAVALSIAAADRLCVSVIAGDAAKVVDQPRRRLPAAAARIPPYLRLHRHKAFGVPGVDGANRASNAAMAGFPRLGPRPAQGGHVHARAGPASYPSVLRLAGHHLEAGIEGEINARALELTRRPNLKPARGAHSWNRPSCSSSFRNVWIRWSDGFQCGRVW